MALAYLMGSPAQSHATRVDPQPAFSRSDLTSRDLARDRSNREAPIHTLLSLSCLALGNRLAVEFDAYWKSVELAGQQFKPEIERFADFLKRRVENGTLRIHWLPELLDFELARNELRFLSRRRLMAEVARRAPVNGSTALALNPLVRIARFPCDATALFNALSRGGSAPRAVSKQQTYVLLSVLQKATPEVVPTDPVLGKLLWALRCVGTFCGGDEQRAALVDMGVLVSA